MDRQPFTILGFDRVKLYDGNNGNGDERTNKKGTFILHQWGILPSLDLKLGLRHEDVKIHVSNNPATQIPNKGNWIVRNCSWARGRSKTSPSLVTLKMCLMRPTTAQGGILQQTGPLVQHSVSACRNHSIRWTVNGPSYAVWINFC